MPQRPAVAVAVMEAVAVVDTAGDTEAVAVAVTAVRNAKCTMLFVLAAA
jgi:hypothetical protein